MSISSEIERLQSTKATLWNSINAKMTECGLTPPSSTPSIHDFYIYVNQIVSGTYEPPIDYKYVEGPLMIESRGQYFNNYGDNDTNKLIFTCTFKIDGYSKTILNNRATSSNYYTLSVNEDGKLHYVTCYSGTSSSGTFSPTISLDEWHTITFTGTVGTTGTKGGTWTINLDGTDYTITECYRSFQVATSRNLVIGGEGVFFKDVMAIQGSRYSSSSALLGTYTTNIEDATVGEVLNATNNGMTLVSTALVQGG